MFRRLGHVLLIVALLGATGGHWVVLQSLAWANMLADHTQVEPFCVAIVKTFDGKHPCPLCQKIAKGRQSEKKSDVQTESKPLEFSCQFTAFFLSPPGRFTLLEERDAAAALLSNTPPVPPPRSLQG